MPTERFQLFSMIQRVYAQALIELAEAQHAVEAVAQEIQAVAALVAQMPDVTRVLAARTLSLEDRDASCRRIFTGQVSDLVLRFLRQLVKKNRFQEFPGVAAAFQSLYDERHGDIEVRTYSVTALDDASRQRISARIQMLTGRQARLVESVQEDLIGGLKMRVGDEVVDGSVATQLRLIRENLIEKGRASARERLPALLKE